MDIQYELSKAMELFEEQKYREALLAFSEIYNRCEDTEQRQRIFQVLEEVYYTPNITVLKHNYDHNLALLEKYPYLWGGDFEEYEALNSRLFPCSDQIFCCYNRQKDCFFGEYDAKTKDRMRYFFEDLNKPIFVEDEDNFYNLMFLNDNVRASEDFAGDNHIYLYYTSLEPLERLLQTCDLETILKDQKFVFLIGEESRKKYPVDFGREFGIDYSAMEPAPVRIEEIKRICFWYKHAHSGTVLSLGVLGTASGIQMFGGHNFHTYSTVNGENFYYAPEFRELMSKPNQVYQLEEISRFAASEQNDIRLPELPEYLEWLERQRPENGEYTVKELFCGYFVFQYEKRKCNPRIAPTILFDPHMWDTSIYHNIVLSFPYISVLTCVREPIMAFARSYLVGLVGWNEFQAKYLLASDYCNGQYLALSPELLSYYYGFRFEDIKTKPEVVCRAVCKHLNVPYEPQMLKAEAPMKDHRSGNVVKGFDAAPLHWDISSVLSEFDRIRLKIFYEPIHKYYGYPTISPEEHLLSEQQVRELFSYPFRFEHINQQQYANVTPEMLHSWIQSVLQGAWNKGLISPRLIPLEEQEYEYEYE